MSDATNVGSDVTGDVSEDRRSSSHDEINELRSTMIEMQRTLNNLCNHIQMRDYYTTPAATLRDQESVEGFGDSATQLTHIDGEQPRPPPEQFCDTQKTTDTVETSQPYVYAINQVNPPEFDGSRDKARDWLNDFSRIMRANRLKDSETFQRLPCYLKGDAAKWWNVTTRLNHDLKWADFKEKFLMFFCGLDLKEEIRQQLNEARQKTGEHPGTYLVRVLDLCLKFDQSMPEHLMVERVTDGMLNNTRNMLVASRPRKDWTLDWLERVFSEFKLPDKKSKVEKPEVATSPPVPRTLDMSRITCHNCSGKGHYARDCDKPADQARIEKNREDMIRAREARAKTLSTTIPKVINACQRAPSPTVLTPALPCDALARPSLNLNLNGRDVAGRIDCGADMTVLPARLADELKLQKLDWDVEPLKTADNSSMKVTGMASVVWPTSPATTP